MLDSNEFAVIVDSVRGRRHLDATRSSPTSLESVESQQTVLDWILNALESSGIVNVTYVGGYHIQKVIERYPNLGYRFQAGWAHEGEVAGLQLARPTLPGRCLIVRSDVICIPEAVRQLTVFNQDIAAGYYSDGSGQSFVGLIAIPENQCMQAFGVADLVSRRDPGSQLEDWLSAISADGFQVRSVALDLLAAPASDSAAVARTVFGGKGRTLEQVEPLIKSALVLDQVRFKASEWLDRPIDLIEMVKRAFPGRRVVVRSSAGAEDRLDGSGAGRFTSVLDVPTQETDRLKAAVAEVVASYSNEDRDLDALDEVLIQPHVNNLAASGVVLTRDVETGAPYYVLNMDVDSGRSDVVTAGGIGSIDSYYVSRNADIASLGPEVKAAITLARELENLVHLDGLDIEFGIDQMGQVYLFQVRPIARRARSFELADEDLEEELVQIREFLDAHMRPHPILAGDTTVLGTMPDWNPAEMIGTAPRPLSLSLYQTLIGNSAWARARADIGYRDVRPEPLIVSLGGRPFVDVRASLNSFLPVDLDHQTSALWVSDCLRMLKENPSLHDKLEFEVAITCLAFDFDEHEQRLRDAGIDRDAICEFRSCLLRLTDAVIGGNIAPIESQLASIRELERRRGHWLETRGSGMPALARRINALLADCRDYGVVPFSVLARYAFMSLSLLRALRGVGVFSGEEYETLLSSIPTVASELSRDIQRQAAGSLSADEMLARFGHLRPSSYDITSPNYASAQGLLSVNPERTGAELPFPDVSVAEEIFDDHGEQIDHLLKANGFEASARDLRAFVLKSIPGREWAKFEFMKSVNAALESVAQLGAELGFSREEMSFLPIEAVVRSALDSPSGAVQMEFRREIEFNKKRWSLTSALHLPHVVKSIEDATVFRQQAWAPNFISTKRVVAAPVIVDSGPPESSLNGRIVMIQAADPGYDWIFGHPIAGLITEYGGVASHMAIRAAEFGLAAAIGCGELIFNRLRSARLIELDCTNKRVLPLQ